MTDENDRPKLTVVAENTQSAIESKQSAIAAQWAQHDFDHKLIELAANIIRVVRGAGRPYDVIVQCDEVVKAAVEVRDKSKRLPSQESVASALRLKHEEIDYSKPWADRESARQDMVSGALQIAASRLLGQPLQIAQGEREMHGAYMQLLRISEELRLEREAEARAARARAAPQRKPTQKKARKTKPSVKL